MISIPLEVKKKAWLSWGIICAIVSVGSGSFTFVVVEELGSVCLHQTTLLQHLGLPLEGIDKYCTNTEKHSYLNNSILEIVASGGFTWMMLNGYHQGLVGWKVGSPFIKRQSNREVKE